MSRTLSHISIAEICTLVPLLQQAENLPNNEWCLIVDNFVAPASTDDNGPPAEYFSSDGFRITVGKHTLDEALDIVFSPGKPLLLCKKAPEGLIEGILERYRTECRKSFAMREVTMTGTNVTDVWINAYYTSFPCRQCSTRDGAINEQVFHLTPPEAHECLSLEYSSYRVRSLTYSSSWIGLRDVSERHPRLEIVKCRHGGSLLRFADLRYEAWSFLPRTDLDTCLLINRLWSAEVNERGTQLALRPLRLLSIIYDPNVRRLCFNVICAESQTCSNRTFMLSRNAAVDSAIAVNHLRNCLAPPRDFHFDVKYDEDEDIVCLDHSVGPWISKLLCSVENFRFPALALELQKVNAAGAAHFLTSTRHALDACVKSNGLRNVSLSFAHDALEVLTVEHFLQWPYMQNMERIDLQICPRGPDHPGDRRWIRDLFDLPNCKTLDVQFTPHEDYDPDCTDHMFVLLQETLKLFESANNVSGFPNNFELRLMQANPELLQGFQEPAPTYSRVPGPLREGLWNVYVAKNEATGVPLSVYVSPDHYNFTRDFIFRKEPYNLELANASHSRKRCLH